MTRSDSPPLQALDDASRALRALLGVIISVERRFGSQQSPLALLRQIMEDLGDKKPISNLVPEHHTHLRTLQFVIEYRKKVFDTLR